MLAAINNWLKKPEDSFTDFILNQIPLGLVVGEDLERLGELNCFGVNPSQFRIGQASVDFALGKQFKTEFWPDQRAMPVSLATDSPLTMRNHDDSVVLLPQSFCLASTAATLNLPDCISGLLQVRSSAARAGIEHGYSGLIEAGFSGSTVTLELTNALQYHSIKVNSGEFIVQVLFFKHKPIKKHHRYNNCQTGKSGPVQSKGVK